MKKILEQLHTTSRVQFRIFFFKHGNERKIKCMINCFSDKYIAFIKKKKKRKEKEKKRKKEKALFITRFL